MLNIHGYNVLHSDLNAFPQSALGVLGRTGPADPLFTSPGKEGLELSSLDMLCCIRWEKEDKKK
jgi:hypothetical protein